MNGITELRHAIEKDVKENIAKSQDKQKLRFQMRKINEISKMELKDAMRSCCLTPEKIKIRKDMIRRIRSDKCNVKRRSDYGNKRW